MHVIQAPTGDLEAGTDGLVHCCWFADRNLDLLTDRLNHWLQGMGKRLEIISVSHSVQIFDVESGNGLCTAMVMWRLRKRKLKKRKRAETP